MRAIVVGGGIGGLTAALALARRGVTVEVLERAPVLAEAGAGLQLSPNACKVLFDLGLEAPVRAAGFAPERAEVRARTSGKILLQAPLGDFAAKRWGAPYLQIHRADLQGVLLDAVDHTPQIRLRRDTEVAGVEADSGVAVVRLTSGASHTAELVVGCDGVRSAVRAALFGPEAPVFTGQVAWRGVVPTDALPPGCVPPVAGVWTGEGKHFVHYYVRGGAAVNFVGVVERDWREEAWNLPGDPAELAADFAGWPEPVASLCAAARRPFRWALYGRAPLARWSTGRATLLGDACHPMLPFLAQGAAMAIEDAAVLAGRLSDTPDPVRALALYEAQRKPRTTKVQAGAKRNAALFHLPEAAAVAAFGAAAVMDRLKPDGAASRFDWIYGYKAP